MAPLRASKNNLRLSNLRFVPLMRREEPHVDAPTETGLSCLEIGTSVPWLASMFTFLRLRSPANDLAARTGAIRTGLISRFQIIQKIQKRIIRVRFLPFYFCISRERSRWLGVARRMGCRRRETSDHNVLHVQECLHIVYPFPGHSGLAPRHTRP